MFKTELYDDIDNLPDAVKDSIIQRFGCRIINGGPCLGTTAEDVRQGIEDGIYTAFVFVKNKTKDDEASAALQYVDLCGDGRERLWVHDLCRVTREAVKPVESPVGTLINMCCAFAKQIGLEHFHILVNRNLTRLQALYAAYGFLPDDTFTIEAYTVLQKPVSCD